VSSIQQSAFSTQQNLITAKVAKDAKEKENSNFFLEFPLRSLHPLRYSFCWLLIAGCYL